MKLHAVAAAAVGVLMLVGAALTRTPDYQTINLDAYSGDSSVSGHARLLVTRDHGAFHLRGEVTSDRGCVVLKAVQMHLGLYFGSDQVTRVCGDDRHITVDSHTHHSDVVLTADVGPGYDSRIVALSGTGG
jgi:hypothetical protein